MRFSPDIIALAPFIAAVLVATAILIVDFVAPGRRAPILITAFLGLAVVALLVATVPAATGAIDRPDLRSRAFDGAYSVDPLTTFLDLLFVSIVALTIAFAPDYLEERDLPVAEFASVLVFAMSGAMLIAASTDLLVLFLGLELMVLPGYLLAGYHKSDGYSTEGAIKYFLLGSFSSAIFLFGLAFVWGLTGTTRVEGVADVIGGIAAGRPFPPGLALGLAFLMTGVGFKVAAVPFHYWTPDAYQGSPTPVTGYLSVGPKVGAFALVIRLFAEALAPLTDQWVAVVVVLAAVTMTLGNLVALTQDNVKRMLAYSSIAHTGYMLVGLAAWAASGGENPRGMEGLLYYGAAYTFMNLGAFAVVAALQRRLGVTSNLSTFAGLVRREPVLAILMFLFLLSLTGIPPLAGFLGKAYVILAAVETGNQALIALAVVAMLNAAAAAFYYLRVAVYMFMREPAGDAPALSHGRLVWLGLGAATVLTIGLGLFPGIVLSIVQQAAQVVGQAHGVG